MRFSLQQGIIAALALSAIGLTFALNNANDRIEEQRQRIATLRADLETSRSTNAANQRSIDECIAENSAIIGGLRADLEEAQRQAAGAIDEADRLRGALATERRRRSEIYAADPTASQWAATAVPAPIADRLRRDRGAARTAGQD